MMRSTPLFIWKIKMETLAVVILAAGKGTRMKSDKPKVLHRVAGKSMVVHVLDCARKLVKENLHVVVGHQADQVQEEINHHYPVKFCEQKQLLGTGDAVKQVLPTLLPGVKTVLVLCGDVPLIQEATLWELVATHQRAAAAVTVLGVHVRAPSGYGRIILDQKGEMISIREEADATQVERQITLINTGIYCFDRGFLDQAIELIQPDNSQKEYYLTDMVEIAKSKGEKIRVQIMDDARQVIGVNTLDELEMAESLIQQMGNELP